MSTFARIKRAVAFLFGSASLILIAGCFGYFPGRLEYWDSRVDELCAKDGGTQIFERMDLPSDTYERLLNTRGELAVPHETSLAMRPSPIHYRQVNETLHDGSPSVSRRELILVRSADGKVLARKVTYHIYGGEFNPPTIAHRPTRQRYCPPYEFDRLLYERVIRKMP